MEASLRDAKGGVYVAMQEFVKAINYYNTSLDIGKTKYINY